MKTFRLNHKGTSNYALFQVDGNKVVFKSFEFYTGPLLEEKEMNLEDGRMKYAAMLNETAEFLPHDKRQVKVWVPIS